MLWMASFGGGLSGKNSVGHWPQRTVSVLLFLISLIRGMRHRFVCLHCHPWRIAPRETTIDVLLASCNVVCIDKLGDAEERVTLNTWYNVHVLCGMAHVMLEFVHVVCLLHLAGEHAEGLV